MAYKNKQKQRDCWNQWYKRNKEKELKRILKRRKKIRQWFKAYKQKYFCVSCNEKDSCCIDFHHKNRKIFNVSAMVHRGFSINTIKKEIEKCTPLCANCHRKKHLEDI